MACGNVDKKKTTFISTSEMNHSPVSMTVIAIRQSRAANARSFSAFNFASGHKQNITGTANIAFVYIYLASFLPHLAKLNSSRQPAHHSTKLSTPSRLLQMTFMKIKRESNYATRGIRKSTSACARYRHQHH